MKFYTFRKTEKSTIEEIGVGGLKNEGRIYPLKYLGYDYKDMNSLIESITEAELEALEAQLMREETEGIALSNVVLSAPIPVPKQDIICLGINYHAHAKEAKRFNEDAFTRENSYPIYFSKRVHHASADQDVIPAHENMVDSLDYEAELAVIIGKDAKNVSEEDAFSYVFGYTIINDVSARNLQTRHKQWYFGKSLDGFTPMGPCIVTKDTFAKPPMTAVRSYVNGELRQNSTTDLMVYGIARVISELSQGMTLKAGTIISMGTPAGVGMGMEPPQFLKHGDVVCMEIDGIGRLTNQVE